MGAESVTRIPVIGFGLAALFLSLFAVSYGSAQNATQYSRDSDSSRIRACASALQQSFDAGRYMPAGDCECTGEGQRWSCKVPLRVSNSVEDDQFFGIKVRQGDTEAAACAEAKRLANDSNWMKSSGDCICGSHFDTSVCYVHVVPKDYSGPRRDGVTQQ